MPELHLLAGPNGSGKSTFARQVHDGTRHIDYDIPRIINPDVIAQKLRPEDPDAAAALAARQALEERAEALANGESFSIETTLSGKSELRLIDDARAAEYRVTMTYVALESPEQNVRRVDLRAQEERRTVDKIHVFDNSGREFEHVATLERGRAIAMADRIPAWAERALGPQLDLARDRAAVAEEAGALLRGPKASIFAPVIRERSVANETVLTGRVIAVGREHLAVATSDRSFSLLERTALDRTPTVGEEVRVMLREGRGIVESVNRDRDVPERDR